MATLFDLPDLVLLEIFSYLPVRDRIRISRCGPAPRGKEPGRGSAGDANPVPAGGVVLTAGPLLQGLSPLEEAGGRSVVVATCRPDALHGMQYAGPAGGARRANLLPGTEVGSALFCFLVFVCFCLFVLFGAYVLLIFLYFLYVCSFGGGEVVLRQGL